MFVQDHLIRFFNQLLTILICHCRYRYRDHHFLNTLSNLLEVMYGSSEVQKDLIPLSTLHMMTSSHSLFLPTMLDSDEEPSRCQAKGTYGAEQNGEKR